MQKLLLAQDLFESVIDGRKKCTIRAGNRDIQPGTLSLREADAPPLCGFVGTVNVTEVRHKSLDELTDAEAQLDGAATAEEMKQALTRFYPTLRGVDEITIVIWDSADIGRS